MLYKQTFSSKLRENRQLLEVVDDACDVVLNCSKLKKVRSSSNTAATVW